MFGTINNEKRRIPLWLYQNEEVKEIPEGVVGFVYLITAHLMLGPKKYVGKKIFYFSKFKKVKGRKKRVKVASDWKNYWSSSPSLKADVLEYGEKFFRREILHFCINKNQLSYMELKEQVERGVLESDEYYNETIYCRIRKSRNLIAPCSQIKSM